MAQDVERCALGLRDLQPAKERRHCSRDRIRFERRSIRVREDQVKVCAVIRPVLDAEFILALAVRLERGNRGLRKNHRAWLLRLCALEFQAALTRLCQRPGDDRAPIDDVSPTQRKQFTAPASGRRRNLENRAQTPWARCGFYYHPLLT